MPFKKTVANWLWYGLSHVGETSVQIDVGQLADRVQQTSFHGTTQELWWLKIHFEALHGKDWWRRVCWGQASACYNYTMGDWKLPHLNKNVTIVKKIWPLCLVSMNRIVHPPPPPPQILLTFHFLWGTFWPCFSVESTNISTSSTSQAQSLNRSPRWLTIDWHCHRNCRSTATNRVGLVRVGHTHCRRRMYPRNRRSSWRLCRHPHAWPVNDHRRAMLTTTLTHIADRDPEYSFDDKHDDHCNHPAK